MDFGWVQVPDSGLSPKLGFGWVGVLTCGFKSQSEVNGMRVCSVTSASLQPYGL